MDVVLVTLIIATLFVLVGLAEPVAARLRMPYSVVLAVAGLGLGLGARFFLATPLTDALNPVAEALIDLPITSDAILHLFLPVLLFQATLEMPFRRMLDDWVPILVLAVVAVVLATVSVGAALAWTSGIPLMAGLLVGSIVSTTDPSAVVSIFRSISAPQRLARIVEGESLLNDAAAIALFGVFVGFAMRGVPDPDLGEAFWSFPWIMGVAAVLGSLMARVAILAMRGLSSFESAQISVSVGLPALAYIAAEELLHASGVVAVVAAGLTVNLVGPKRVSPSAWSNLRDVWDLLAHWAGAFVFLLAALLIPRFLVELRWTDLGLLGAVVGAAAGSRALVLYALLPALTALRLSPSIDWRYRTAILWGGLRGAVTLALALAVTENHLVAPELRRVVGTLATGYVLFTLLVQGTTLRAAIHLLGLDRLSPLDQALASQVVATALQSVRADVAAATESYGLSRDIARSEAKAFAERLDAAVAAADEGQAILDRDRVTLGLLALAGAERDMLLDRFRGGEVTSEVAEAALDAADLLIEMTRSNGRMGYRRAARAGMGRRRATAVAFRLHQVLRVEGPLARITSERFELLLLQRQTIRDLHGFIDARIRRIHGRRVADLLHELLERRGEEVEQALEGLRLQFPGYAEELERQFIRRRALRFEEREYEALREEGLIGAELHARLRAGLSARRAALDRRPVLDLAVQKEELVQQFPLFAALGERERRDLSRALTTRYVAAGEVVLKREEPPRAVYFIASGAVEVDTAGQVTRLGRGEMFGQLAVLAGRRRRAEVRAITHGVLLALDEVGFRELITRSDELRGNVRDSALRRGVSEETLAALGLGPGDSQAAAAA